MKNKFTIQFLLSFFLCIFTYGVNAQLVFNVDSPAGISGNYDMLPAGFGGEFPNLCNPDPITGEIKIGEDGTDPITDACEAVVNDLTGFIALIDRGTCSFSQKCANAEAAGAIAVIVCNNNNDPIFAMGNTAGFVNTVPALMISQSDCDVIRMESNVQVTISFIPPPPGTSVVFWGDQPLEGDFDGGLNDWTTTSEAPCDTLDLWEWVSNGSTIGATVPNNFGDAVSQAPTACNGAMVFNSDGFDQSGLCGASQFGELISPVLDLSTLVPAGTAGVSVLFHQTTRQFQSNHIVSYTNDGTTWNDILINDELEVNTGNAADFKRVFLPDADLNSSTFQFKFRYEANYYYWIIDDVQLIETEAHNMQANNFYAISPNLLTPASQTDSIRFLIDVENIGATDQENVNVNMNIVNSAGTEVYNEDLAYGTVPANFVDENRIFPGHFLPDAAIDTFTATYTVTADSADFDLSNNNQTFSFQITDSTFAKEDATNLFGASPQGVPELTWTMATSYFVRNGDNGVDPNIRYECTSVLVGLDNVADNVGGFVNIYLYEWVDDGDGISQNTERTVIGNYTHTIDGTETDIKVPLENWDVEGDPIELKANTNYVLAAGLTSAGTSKIELSSTNDNDLGATNFLTDSITIVRQGAFWNTTVDDGGLNSDLTPLTVGPRMRMHINEFAKVSVNQPLDQANKLNIYPNPATEVVNMELDLVEDLNNAVVRIVDLNARNLMEVTYDKLSNQTLTYSVANLAAGTYFIKIQSDKGFITQKFTIVK